MKNRIDVRKALRVCDKATRFGERSKGGFEIEGIVVQPHFGCSSVTLSDPQTSVHLYFHNRYLVDTEDSRAMTRFLKRLDQIDSAY